jgi:hypothetical protein
VGVTTGLAVLLIGPVGRDLRVALVLQPAGGEQQPVLP